MTLYHAYECDGCHTQDRSETFPNGWQQVQSMGLRLWDLCPKCCAATKAFVASLRPVEATKPEEPSP